MARTQAVTTTHPATPENPFRREVAQHLSAGAVAIEESRAVAEAQGKLLIAKRFPRNEAAAVDKIMEECSRPKLAAEATYKFPRGGSSVSGASIRLAEVLARCWGNISYGIRELSRREGESEMEAYAWDMETNTESSQKFTVKHLRDKQGGAQVLTDERDIYEIGANMGARRLRARILAIIPGDIEEAALERCRQTMAGNSDIPLADRVRKMVSEFAKLGVKSSHLEKRVGKPLADLLGDDLAELAGIYKSIRDGMSKATDWFGTVAKPASSVAAAVQEAARGGVQAQGPDAEDEEGGEPGDFEDPL
jgi:hypothetical protein